jgi:ankyrin repeat protein
LVLFCQLFTFRTIVEMQRRHSSTCQCSVNTHHSSLAQSLTELDFARSLHQAVVNHNHEKVKAMILKNPDAVHQLDQSGYTPLLYACGKRGNLEIAKVLVQAGACVNAVTREGKVSCLMRACMADNPAIAEFLIENGAVGRCLEDSDGRSAIDFIEMNEKWNRDQKDRVVKKLNE